MVIHFEYHRNQCGIENEVEDEMNGDRSPNSDVVQFCPIPHFQGIFQIDDDHHDGRDHKGKRLKVSLSHSARSSAVRDGQIRNEENDTRGQNAVDDTFSKDLLIEQFFVLSRRVSTEANDSSVNRSDATSLTYRKGFFKEYSALTSYENRGKSSMENGVALRRT